MSNFNFRVYASGINIAFIIEQYHDVTNHDVDTVKVNRFKNIGGTVKHLFRIVGSICDLASNTRHIVIQNYHYPCHHSSQNTGVLTELLDGIQISNFNLQIKVDHIYITSTTLSSPAAPKVVKIISDWITNARFCCIGFIWNPLAKPLKIHTSHSILGKPNIILIPFDPTPRENTNHRWTHLF